MSSEPPPRLRVDGAAIDLLDGESVLEALERAGVDVPSGCRSGTCKKCMVQGEGSVPAAAQRSLRPQARSQGFFLACQARPESGVIDVRDAAGPDAIGADVAARDDVSEDVARLLLRPSAPLGHRPGQYLDVFHPAGEHRSYSIASLPSEELLELHVRRVPDGLVSGWLHTLERGDRVDIRGPFGQCFYDPDEPARKLLLAGAGTGLAPLLGIARDALDRGHGGPIDLVHGGLDPGRLYLRDELGALAARWPQLRVHHCVLRGATAREHQGALDELAIRLAGDLGAARAFLCGDDAIVRKLQRSLFLAGLPSGEIFADPFEPAARGARS